MSHGVIDDRRIFKFSHCYTPVTIGPETSDKYLVDQIEIFAKTFENNSDIEEMTLDSTWSMFKNPVK